MDHPSYDRQRLLQDNLGGDSEEARGALKVIMIMTLLTGMILGACLYAVMS